MKTINLYNHFHYGDIFMSRGIIQSLSEHYHINYYHNLKQGLLKDLKNVTEIVGIPGNISPNQTVNGNFYNTWIGTIPNAMGIFEHYKLILGNILSELNLPSPENEKIIPVIKFEELQTFKIDEFIRKNLNTYRKFVLICTGDVHSQQSENFDFTPIVNHLSENYKDIFFITTTPILEKNNLTSTDQINNLVPDLLEISYISKFCDIIVGRSSGPYSYCLTKENLTDPKKTFVSFNHRQKESNLLFDLGCNTIWSNNYNYENIINTINNLL